MLELELSSTKSARFLALRVSPRNSPPFLALWLITLSQIQSEQFADLNGKLRLVEKLRDENAEREAEIARVLRQQQQYR